MRARYATALLLCALPAMAQTPSCKASNAPQLTRLGSAAEPLGDVLLSCSGGAASLQILVIGNASFANQNLSPSTNPSWGLTDVLLLIDDPAPAAQSVCVPESQGVNCSSTAGYNVFQGTLLQNNIIAFQALPYPSGSHTLRIVNLRGNFSQSATAPKLQLEIFSGGNQISVQNNSLTFSSAVTPIAASLVVPTGTATTAKGITVVRNTLPLGNPSSSTFQIQVAETQPGVFRRRDIGASAANPTFLSDQDTPGVSYPTETSFYNSQFPQAYGLSIAGLATSGTRIRMEFDGIPNNVLVWVSVQDTGSSAPHALLTYTDNTGAGAYSAESPWIPGYSQLYVTNGTGIAVWEIVASDTTAADSLTFNVALSALNGSPGLGAGTVSVSLAPPATSPLTYPAFALSNTVIPAFNITNEPPSVPLVTVSSASLTGAISPGSLATIMGSALTTSANSASPPVATLSNLQVNLIDSSGASHTELLYYAGPTQVNFYVDTTVALGPGVIQVVSNSAVVAAGTVQVNSVAPGLFSAAGSAVGPPSGLLVRISSTATAPATLAVYNGSQWNPATVSFGASGDLLYLLLYGTGIRNRSSLAAVSALIGSTAVPVILADADPSNPGIDDITIGPLPLSLASAGAAQVQIQVDGASSNKLTVQLSQ